MCSCYTYPSARKALRGSSCRQGVLLLGWLVVQIAILRFVFILHIAMAVVGLLLLAAGIYLYKKNILVKQVFKLILVKHCNFTAGYIYQLFVLKIA